MEDHRLSTFCLIVETGSFSKAAELRFITQSAVSHLVRNLEDQVGARLLCRKGKSVQPTKSGEIFYKRAKQILQEYKKIEGDIHSLINKVEGNISIGASETAAAYLLPQALYAFHVEFPDVSIEVLSSSSESLKAAIMNNRIDMGIIEDSSVDEVSYAEPIASDDVVLIAPENSPLFLKNKISPEDVAKQVFILPETASSARLFLNKFIAANGINIGDINVAMTTGNPELTIKMVQSGIGIAFISKWAVFGALKEGYIKTVDIGGKKLSRKFYLICREKEPIAASARAFKKFISQYSFFEPF